MQDQHSGAAERRDEPRGLHPRDALAKRKPRQRDDRQRCERQQQDRVQRGGVRQRQIDQRLEAGDAGQSEQRDQLPVLQQDRAVPAQIDQRDRQQHQQRQRPAQEVQRGRGDGVVQRAADHEIARPQQRGQVSAA
jgi:hypothetical protein